MDDIRVSQVRFDLLTLQRVSAVTFILCLPFFFLFLFPFSFVKRDNE